MATPGNERSKIEHSVISLANNSDNYRARIEALGGRLLQKLQTTLVLEEILSLFAEELRQLVNFHIFEYRHGSHHFVIDQKQTARHELDYKLTLRDADLGTLKLRRSYRFKEAEMEAVESLLGSLVYPLRNATLYREAQLAALTDSLTGAANKRALDYQMQRDLSFANRYQHPLTFLLIDIDHFKLINDTHGHAAGDAVLKAVVERINRCCRDSDTVFRLGGEEFGVILANASLTDAWVIAERMRQAVSDKPFAFGKVSIPVTISLGCANYHPNESGNELIARADAALYQAKRNGRNQTRIAQGDQPHADLPAEGAISA
ncbi:MAG: diguanylate cyclase [Hahellaceae bacterium]|nr:diguanylate cyclase [Hahellaceae bacterium]